MRLSNFSVLTLASASFLFGQGAAILSVAPPNRIAAKRGAPVEAKLAVKLQDGFHVNSNTPSESYLIPLKLTWTPGALQPGDVVYPKPHLEKYEFSPKPLSVFTGGFTLLSKFQVPATAAAGNIEMVGKLRYQACNDTTCFPPKTVEVRLPVEIR